MVHAQSYWNLEENRTMFHGGVEEEARHAPTEGLQTLLVPKGPVILPQALPPAA